MQEIKAVIRPVQRIRAVIKNTGSGGGREVNYGSSYEAHVKYSAVVTETTVVNINEE